MQVRTPSQSTERSRQDRILDYSFLIGIGLKILNIIGDILVGIPLLLISKAQIIYLTHFLTAGELVEDPSDQIAHFLVKTTAGLDNGTLIFLGVYFLIHAFVKIGIIVALVKGTRNVYPWAIAALTALLLYQVVNILIKFSLPLTILSVLDAVIIWLTWREWRHHRTLRDVLVIYAPKMAQRWPFQTSVQ